MPDSLWDDAVRLKVQISFLELVWDDHWNGKSEQDKGEKYDITNYNGAQ